MAARWVTAQHACHSAASTSGRGSGGLLVGHRRAVRTRMVMHAAPGARPEVPRLDNALDDQLSNRWLDLDPAGYFIIGTRAEEGKVFCDHYTNTISSQGLACDPDTGEPIACTGGGPVRKPTATYTGRTAKELSVLLFEGEAAPFKHLRVEHANYLGRELQRAEFSLITGDAYVQD